VNAQLSQVPGIAGQSTVNGMTASTAQWSPRAPEPVAGPAPTATLDVVIPVFNEEADLEPCVRRVHAYLCREFPYPFQLTIADNASTDGTAALADRLAMQLPGVRAVHLAQKGRGRALHAVWSTATAPVLAYMDVDLSTDLAALLPLVAPLISGHSDVAIGSRLSRGSRVVRGPKREFISRGYNLLLRGTLQARFSDAQCGFKAIRADVARQLLPLVRDTGWFFDTELLVLAERAGLRIHEVPVDWVDDPDSRVDIVATAMADLKGIWRLTRGFASGAIGRTGRADRRQPARHPAALPALPGLGLPPLQFRCRKPTHPSCDRHRTRPGRLTWPPRQHSTRTRTRPSRNRRRFRRRG
jgi:hypothetical protein